MDASGTRHQGRHDVAYGSPQQGGRQWCGRGHQQGDARRQGRHSVYSCQSPYSLVCIWPCSGSRTAKTGALPLLRLHPAPARAHHGSDDGRVVGRGRDDARHMARAVAPLRHVARQVRDEGDHAHEHALGHRRQLDLRRAQIQIPARCQGHVSRSSILFLGIGWGGGCWVSPAAHSPHATQLHITSACSSSSTHLGRLHVVTQQCKASLDLRRRGARSTGSGAQAPDQVPCS